MNKSRSLVYDDTNNEDPNAIKFTPWDSSVHENTREKMKTSPAATSSKGLSWLDTDRMMCMVEPLQVNYTVHHFLKI